MNRANFKCYAPQARRDFIQAMTDRAAFYGLTAEKIEPVIEQGDVAMIGGRAFLKSVTTKRKRLENRVKRDGFGQTMETMARVRTESVIPLQSRYAANIEQLANDISSATSTSQRKKLEKERDKLIKQQAELQTFDEKLKHAANQRITLDLDDGVKVNYGKFGDLLAEVKAVCGTKEDV